MSYFWLAPPILLIAGVAWGIHILRTTNTLAADIHHRLGGLDEINGAVATVRVETESTRASLEQLRRR